jgi:hypothetical protein
MVGIMVLERNPETKGRNDWRVEDGRIYMRLTGVPDMTTESFTRQIEIRQADGTYTNADQIFPHNMDNAPPSIVHYRDLKERNEVTET